MVDINNFHGREPVIAWLRKQANILEAARCGMNKTTIQMKRPHGLRMVQAGRVRLAGRVYEPDQRHMDYDGRLDGLRCHFAGYYYRPSLISLVGVQGYEDKDRPDMVDGAFPWYFWVQHGDVRPQEA